MNKEKLPDKEETVREAEQETEEITEKYAAIRELMMQATTVSRSMYLPEGSLGGLSIEEEELKLRQQREQCMAEHGTEIMNIFAEIKNNKVGRPVNWEAYVAVTKKAIRDILSDNEKMEKT